jgi:hypothetical protein
LIEAERLCIYLCFKKYFVFQSVSAKKNYFMLLIIFSNASTCSLNAFSPAFVME